jgi:urease accessory protein UreE
VPEFDVEDRITEELALEERERQKERLLRIIDKKNQSFIKLRDRSFTSDEN